MYTIYPSKNRKNKSRTLRIKILEVLPLMEIGNSFDIPLKDFNGEYKDFQSTVTAVIGKCRDKDKKYATTQDKFKDLITVTRIV